MELKPYVALHTAEMNVFVCKQFTMIELFLLPRQGRKQADVQSLIDLWRLACTCRKCFRMACISRSPDLSIIEHVHEH